MRNSIHRSYDGYLVILIVSLCLIGWMMSSVSMGSYLSIIITVKLIYAVNCDTYFGSHDHDDYVSLYKDPHKELQKCKFTCTLVTIYQVYEEFPHDQSDDNKICLATA